MGIRFYCPNGHKLNVKSFQAGMRGICPYCGTSVQIPTTSTRPSSKDPRARSSSSEIRPDSDQPTQPQPPAGENPSTGTNPPAGREQSPPRPPAADAKRTVEGDLPPAESAGETPGGEMEPPVGESIDTGLPNWTVPVDAPADVIADPLEAAWTNGPADEPFPATGSPISAPQTSRPTPPTREETDPLAAWPDVVWYVRPASGGQFGPATSDVMRSWIAEGRVGGDSLVWREGWRDWQAASAVFPHMGADQRSSGPTGIVTERMSTGKSSGGHRRQSGRRSNKTNAIVVVILLLAVVLLVVALYYVLNR